MLVDGRVLEEGRVLEDVMVAKGGRTGAMVGFRLRGRFLLGDFVEELRAAMAGGGERMDGTVGFLCRGRLLLELFVGEVRAAMAGGGARISSGERVQWPLRGWDGERVWVGGNGN